MGIISLLLQLVVCLPTENFLSFSREQNFPKILLPAKTQTETKEGVLTARGIVHAEGEKDKINKSLEFVQEL